jgi:hypothetical protein
MIEMLVKSARILSEGRSPYESQNSLRDTISKFFASKKISHRRDSKGLVLVPHCHQCFITVTPSNLAHQGNGRASETVDSSPDISLASAFLYGDTGNFLTLERNLASESGVVRHPKGRRMRCKMVTKWMRMSA